MLGTQEKRRFQGLRPAFWGIGEHCRKVLSGVALKKKLQKKCHIKPIFPLWTGWLNMTIIWRKQQLKNAGIRRIGNR